MERRRCTKALIGIPRFQRKCHLEAQDLAFRGGKVAESPDDGPADYMNPRYGHEVTRGSHTPFYRKPPNVYNSGQAVCGGKGCLRACMISLEARDVLQNKFHGKFRRRKPWSVNWDEFEGFPEGMDFKNPVKDPD